MNYKFTKQIKNLFVVCYIIKISLLLNTVIHINDYS